MRKIALVPVYNEESTLIEVLEGIIPLVDILVLVDDGSTDGSLDLARRWAQDHSNTEILALPHNHGMSTALREGFVHVVELLREGNLHPDDLLVTLDADGQHDPKGITAISEHMRTRGLDVALTRRDFVLYPIHKRWGNRLLTLWGRLWSGYAYHDIESGFRGLRLEVLPPLLEYYAGYRYSCAQEIAILTARLGFKIDNSFPTEIRRYRSHTALRDVFVNAFWGLWSFVRWLVGWKRHRKTTVARPVVPTEPV